MIILCKTLIVLSIYFVAVCYLSFVILFVNKNDRSEIHFLVHMMELFMFRLLIYFFTQSRRSFLFVENRRNTLLSDKTTFERVWKSLYHDHYHANKCYYLKHRITHFLNGFVESITAPKFIWSYFAYNGCLWIFTIMSKTLELWQSHTYSKDSTIGSSALVIRTVLHIYLIFKAYKMHCILHGSYVK